MTVEVFSPVIAVSGPAVTSFSDTFVRASGAAGKNWAMGGRPFSPVVSPVAEANGAIGNCNDAIQGWIWTMIGNINPNTIWFNCMVPIPVYLPLYSKTQFAQCTVVGEVNTGSEYLAGPSVLNNLDVQNYSCYYAETALTSNLLRILRVSQGTLSVIGSFVGGVAAGDVIRLTVTPGASNVFGLSKNGGAVQSFTDAAPTFTTGSPGLFARGAGGVLTSNQQWRNFSCGPGA